MGKSGSRKKKLTANASQGQISGGNNHSASVINGGVSLDSSVFLKRAHELKEEGNRRFQDKDFLGALQHYEDALKLTPKTSPERAVFHSNRAACLMQMKPIDYDTVISECTLALQVQPRYARALLRRARAYEAIGKHEFAMIDVQALLSADPNNHDALEIAERLSMVSAPRQEAQPDLQRRPSPAALGASAVRGAPVSGIGPCLPARPLSKKPTPSTTHLANKDENPFENGREAKINLPKVVLKPCNGPSKTTTDNSQDSRMEKTASSSSIHPLHVKFTNTATRWRPLKLVYDHDIRIAQMPVNCSFKVLRGIVSKRFPMSKSVLIKYLDSDGDLVTLTCSAEVKIAESLADNIKPKIVDADKGESIGMLRLHIVEVSPKQEPPLLEEDEGNFIDDVRTKGEEILPQNVLIDSGESKVDTEIDHPEKYAEKEKPGVSEDPDFKEVEMDDWLFEFAQLFRTHIGIDPDAHIDLHEFGMELCSEALEETVTSEDAQILFDKAAVKFQEVAALAFFNWGNVHMCAARKKIPIEESTAKEMVASQLQNAYDWVREKYSLAKEKYEEALLIKPDFYEGLLALGQQQFEMAKLHWSFVLAKNDDLSKWDPTETLSLFDSAEKKMKAATEMWEKLEIQRAKELKDPILNMKDELLKRRKKHGTSGDGDSSNVAGQGEISPEEAAEQAAVMRSQIHLFWGNMLFERSQVECKLGLPGWKKNLDDALDRFKLAGASEIDVSTVLKNHCSNVQAADDHEKKVEDVNVNKVDTGDN